MLLKKIYCIFLILCLFTKLTVAQAIQGEYVGRADMAKIFKQMNNWFVNTSTYTVSVTHTSFESYTSKVPFEKTTGYIRKKDNDYHSFLIGIHTVQNRKYKIVIDSSEKIIVVSNSDKLVWNNYNLSDYDALLEKCTTIKLISVIDNIKLYRLDFNKESTISHYEFLIDQKGFPKEIVWYYNEEVKKTDESEKLKPRVSISFSNYATTFSSSNDEFDETIYFFKNNNVLQKTETYSHYTLYDQRN